MPPKHPLHPPQENNDGNSPKCPICLEDFTTLSRAYPCEHEFDYDCIIPWLGRQYNEHFNTAELTRPCCRNSIATIRYSYRPDGSYSTLDVTTNFRSRYFNPGMAPVPVYFDGFWSGSIVVYNHHFGPQHPRRDP